MRSSYRPWLCVLLAAMALAKSTPARAQRPITLQSEAQQAAEAEIVGRLKQTVSSNFRQQPLSQVLDQLAKSAGVPIRLDARALEDASIGAEMPVTFDANKVSLRAALTSMLGPMDLTWLVKNEAIWVTTPEKAGNELIVKIYPVYDLVTAGQVNRKFSGYQPLIDLIVATLAPTTWDEVGGPGSIHAFRGSGALIIGQTFEVHEEIEKLLRVLRRVRDDQHIAHEDPVSRPGATKRPSRTSAMPAASRPTAPATVLLTPNVYD